LALVRATLAVVAALALAAASWHWVELPFLRRLRTSRPARLAAVAPSAG